MSKEIVVLSLFNGMSTGYQALINAGFNVKKYYSSEIKKNAIKITAHHFPDVIELGDILNWKNWDIDWKSVDLVLSGSPCKDLSNAGNKEGIYGANSSLFFVFIDILEHIRKVNPNVSFLQENVGSASRLDIGIMSRELGVYPVRINSSLVTAQLRDRYYWTNIKTARDGLFGDTVTDIPQPKDRGILFKDILTDGFVFRDKSLTLMERQGENSHFKDPGSEKAQEFYKKRVKRSLLPVVYNLVSDLLFERDGKLFCKTNTKKGYAQVTENDCLNLAFPTSTKRRGRITKGKSPALLQTDEPLYAVDGLKIRLLNKIELCRLQGFPDNYCDILTRNQAAGLLGDGWTLTVIEHILQFYKP